MSTKAVVYLEDHTVRYSIIPDIPRHLNFKQPVCVLIEAGPASLEVEVLKQAARDLAARKSRPISYYREIAGRSKNFWPENFQRELQAVLYLAEKLPTIEFLDITGIDPRTSNVNYDEFNRHDRIFPKLTALNGEPLKRAFLEEQAFMAWYAARTLLQKEWGGYEQFVLCVGSLHFASLARYLGAPERKLQFLRLPAEQDRFLRLINAHDKKVVWKFLANGEKNSDAWQLYKFFCS